MKQTERDQLEQAANLFLEKTKLPCPVTMDDLSKAVTQFGGELCVADSYTKTPLAWILEDKDQRFLLMTNQKDNGCVIHALTRLFAHFAKEKQQNPDTDSFVEQERYLFVASCVCMPRSKLTECVKQNQHLPEQEQLQKAAEAFQVPEDIAYRQMERMGLL